MPDNTCTATTAAGKPCRNRAVRGSTTCKVHHSTTEEISKALRSKGQCNYTKRNGERCKKPPLHGTTVCDRHGGAAKHIRQKAQRRLDAMIMPALSKLNDILMAPGTSDTDKVRVALAVLDRTGFGKGSTVDVTVEVKPWEKTMESILTEVSTDVYELEDIEDAEVVEETLPPVEDYSMHERFPGPRIGHEGRIRPEPDHVSITSVVERPNRRRDSDDY